MQLKQLMKSLIALGPWISNPCEFKLLFSLQMSDVNLYCGLEVKLQTLEYNTFLYSISYHIVLVKQYQFCFDWKIIIVICKICKRSTTCILS